MKSSPVITDDMPPQQRPADESTMEQSVAALLQAAGFSLEHSQLQETPSRVTECWKNSLLDGYNSDPAQILAERFPTPDDGLVVVDNIACHGMCPHHLLPFFGTVHVAYIPSNEVVGFSCIGKLIRCLTHRLTLQETATHQIAEALMLHLDAKGAACVMQAQQLCMSLRQESQCNSRIVTSSFLGEFKQRTDLQQLLYNKVQ
ncbi:MAG: GTP cyclohydrolase I [Deltaproteobacteria bacterium]|nr:MAG: GTP cyclohydrolase I [Deltaproteobacteria bacterium]